MELWTEYEGRTIDGLFPLTKLLRPEGRSAFFLTANGNGIPRVIRLIEPHFDEEEILARWNGVLALNHPNILKLEKFGQVELEDGSFLYAVMEPVDANLGEVVVQQRLTVPEARQLAESLISAIDTLHSHGFVHEHIQPAHVFAVGEVVKLRSDCIREAPEGNEGQELKRRDLQDFAVVLLQALTQHKTLEATSRNPLPSPFDRIVPRAMSGEWGVTEIAAALVAADTSLAAPPRDAPVELPVSTADPEPLAAPPPPGPARLEASPSPARVEADAQDEERSTRLSPKWIAIGVAVLLAIWLGWHFLSSPPANQTSAQPAAAAPIPAVTTSPGQPSNATTAPATAKAPANQRVDPRNQWRVIAYTYNRQDQAQHKAAVVAKAHPDLRSEVFTPTGRAPYLVTIGGAMTREEAFALAAKVRSNGLPRDTYAQNYTGTSR